MKEYSSIGLIKVKNKLNIEFSICKIEYLLKEDESFTYKFTPYYDVIELLDSNIFQGIPGLNLDLRKEIYIRENVVPVFISERVPNENREDYQELLKKVSLDYMDPIKYLIRTNEEYSGDKLYLKEYTERKYVYIETQGTENTQGIVKRMIDNIALGNTVILNNEKINTKEVFDSLFFLYEKSYNSNKANQRNGINESKRKGVYKGRKPKEIDHLAFLVELDKVKRKIETSKDAARNLKISIDKYYRYKKLQNIK